MDKDVIRLIATMGAVKLMLGRLYSMVYAEARLRPEQIAEMHKRLLENLPKQILVQTSDPGLSDLLSAEIESEIRSILKGVEQDLGMVSKTG